MKLQIITISFLQVLLIPTRLILVLQKQFLIYLMTKTSQFSLEPITQSFAQYNPNLFTFNPHNPQQVLIKGSTMTFENGNSYDLSDPDLQNFITNTQTIKRWDSIYNFLNDMKYDLNYGDKKSIRYQFIKEIYSRYQLQGYAQTHDLQGFAQGSSQSPTHPQSSMDNTQGNQLQSYVGSQSGSQLGSGLNGESYREISQQYIFLPSDPDELVDQLKLLYFEKVGRNDSF